MNRSVLIVLSLALVGCQTPPTPPPTKPVSLSSVFRLAKLEEIDSAIGQAIAAGKAPGAVVRIESGRAVYQKTFGDKATKPERSPMTADTIFDAASLTKVIVTAPAIALLIEQGKLGLDDRVEKWIPGFKKNGKGAVTIRHLLTHTSGQPNVSSPRSNSTLAELVMSYSKVPLNFEPGTRWQYSNSGINTLGRIVEVVSGKRFEVFLQERILDPCGMADTTFWPDEKQAKRLAKTYRTVDGELEEAGNYFVKGGLSDRSRTPYPAGGLFSTARDMMRFYQMMLHGGVVDGNRLLKKKSVKELTRTQTGDIKTGFVTGMSWGLGFQVVKEPQGVTEMVSPGTYGHGGAYATNSWADPKTGLIYILMIQRAGFPNADNSPVRKAFQQAAADQFAR